MKPAKENRLTTRLAIKTPEVLRDIREVISTLDDFVLSDDPNATRVDVLVLEIGSDPDTELRTIRALLEEGVVGTLFITSSVTTSDILLPALRTGAKEFFQQPIVPDEVREAFLQVKRQGSGQTGGTAPPRNGRLISVLGAKGGVGTTTFAVNLATGIQEIDQEKQVALVDMNRLVGEVPLFLDMEIEVDWEEIGRNINRLDETYLKSALARHSSGIYVLPAPSRIDDRGTQLKQDYLIQILKTMKDHFDYIVVDAGMYHDETVFRIQAMAEIIFLISTLNLPCIINVKRLKDTLRKHCGETNGKIRVIANRFEKKAQINLTEASKIVGDDITDTIPNDYALTMKAINSGKVLAEVGKYSSVAKAYRYLAESVAKTSEPKSSRWKFFG